jgi:topoisomerase-4 subunit A
LLLAANSGYGFIASLADLVSKNKAGKACLSVGAEGTALAPVQLPEGADQHVVAVTSQGRMLVFPLSELPQMTRGKGNRIINVPSAAFKSGEEYLVAVEVVGAGDELLVVAGQRHLRMKLKDLANYVGERARRGRKLPRGFQKVDSLAVERR